MAVESTTYISGLNTALPTATDSRAEGDDHLRLLKSALKATFPNISSAVTPTHLELNYVAGVTGHIQTQFAGVQTQFGGVTTALALKAALAGPTFTGTVVLPSTTSIGSVSATEIGYLDGVTGPIQTQLDNKISAISPTLTGTPTAPTAAPGTSTTQIATTAFVAAQAMSAALPGQAGNSGKYLQTDGSTASWAAAAAGSGVTAFAASGTWTKPAGKSFHLVEAWGAGGGGGSGARGAAATQRSPGYGGGGGAMVSRVFLDAELSATETVTIGAGGAGGAAITVNSTAGAVGGNGGNSTFGTKLTAYGGGGAGVSLPGGGGGVLGAGAADAPGAPVAPGADGHFGGASVSGGNFSTVYGGGSGYGGNFGSMYGGGGGGYGAGIDSANAFQANLSGGFGKPTAGGAAGTVGSRPGAAGTGRSGGGGGYAGDTAGTIAGGNGGAGGTAAGGGGGGASTNGANSGAGGAGGNGLVRVYSW